MLLRAVVVLALLMALSSKTAPAEVGAGRYAASRTGQAAEARADRGVLIWPIKGPVISPFGSPRPQRSHRGIDIKAPQGARIHAAAAGTVVFSGRESSYGRTVKIAHPNGLSTVYAHNSANLVKSGDRVRAGTVIATVGHTGRATTNHLHFEVRREGVARNPLRLLPHSPRPSPRPNRGHMR
jgi:murein DD-endopeptidase MepM/ murein hydrolase activator NlpD